MPLKYQTRDGLIVVETVEPDNEDLNEMFVKMGIASGYILKRFNDDDELMKHSMIANDDVDEDVDDDDVKSR